MVRHTLTKDTSRFPQPAGRRSTHRLRERGIVTTVHEKSYKLEETCHLTKACWGGSVGVIDLFPTPRRKPVGVIDLFLASPSSGLPIKSGTGADESAKGPKTETDCPPP
jgi:hypothetical protein